MPIKSKYTKINKKGKEKEISKKKYTKLQKKYSTKTGSDMQSSGGSSYTTAGPRGKKVKVTITNSAGNAKKGMEVRKKSGEKASKNLPKPKPKKKSSNSFEKIIPDWFAVTMKKGGTLSYEPTAKYGKTVKPSMFMSGGELKKYKKGKK